MDFIDEKSMISGVLAPVLFVCAGLAAQPPGPGANRARPKDNQWEARASRLAASMDRETLAAQVIITAVNGRDAVSEKARRLLTEIPAGEGVINENRQ